MHDYLIKRAKPISSRICNGKEAEDTGLVSYSAQTLSRSIKKKAEVIYMELIQYFKCTSFQGP